MTTTELSLADAASRFLALSRFAVAGISAGEDTTAQTIYDKLATTGKPVYGLNPRGETIAHIICYPSLSALPEPVDGLVIVTSPSQNQRLLEQAKEAGVQWVWIHKSLGNSVDDKAVQIGRQQGLHIIDGACPMMFLEPVDSAHKCLKVLLQWTGRIPKRIPALLLEDNTAVL